MSKHIDSLHVQNFRCLKDFKIENLGDVNLLVGKNNSGKSTVLDAIRVYIDELPMFGLKDIAVEKYEITKEYTKPDFIIKFFSTGSEQKKIMISSCKNKNDFIEFYYGYATLELENEIHFSEEMPSVINHTQEAIGIRYNNELKYKKSIIDFSEDRIKLYKKQNGIRNTNCRIYSLICSNKNIGLPSMTDLSDAWDRVKHIKEYKSEILEVLSFIDNRIEDFDFYNWEYNKQYRYIKFLLKGHLEPISITSMGDGISIILTILISAFSCKDGILLIDEFENGLHFSVQKKLWEVIFKIAKDLNIQVFATTHSLDAVKSFSEVAVENKELDGALFRIGKNRITGEVMASFYDEDELYNDVQKEREVR